MEDLAIYELAQKLIGPVPPQYEIIYAIMVLALIVAIIIVALSPLLIFKAFSR